MIVLPVHERQAAEIKRLRAEIERLQAHVGNLEEQLIWALKEADKGRRR
jgi:hypothetical protein